MVKKPRNITTNYLKTLHPNDKTRLNSITETLKIELQKLQNQEWEEKLATLSTHFSIST